SRADRRDAVALPQPRACPARARAPRRGRALARAPGSRARLRRPRAPDPHRPRGARCATVAAPRALELSTIVQAPLPARGDPPGVSSFLDALRAYGPAAGEAERLMLFGQFVGTWSADVVYQPLVGAWEEARAEWLWGWTLQGRAVQDVYI